MNTKLFVLLALLLVTISAFQHQSSNAVRQKIEKIRQTKSWAAFMLNMAELQVLTGNPLGELIEAIEVVQQDLENKLESADENYQKRTEYNQSETKRIQSLISSAVQDIADTHEYITNILQLQLVDLENLVVKLETGIEFNRQYISDETAKREVQHEEFLKVTQETKEVVEVIDEALAVFNQLDGSEASFAQLKSKTGVFKKKVSIFEQKAKKSTEKSMVIALANVAISSQFADKQSIDQVQQLFRDIKNNLISANSESAIQEEQSQANFETDMEDRTLEIKKWIVELDQANKNIVITTQLIADNKDFIVQREQDQKEAEEDLQQEQDSFEKDTKTYEDLVQQLNIEQNAIQLAIDHLSSADIEDYIGDRMQSDVILNKPHGEGITVEKL